MSRMAELNVRRADERRARASAAVSSILEGAAAKGVGITVIGSFARGDFRAHSDIDLLVRGPVDPKRRVLVERLVADGIRGSDIPYDLIFEADLTEDRVQDLLNDVL